MITVLILSEAYTKPTVLRKASVNKRSEYSVWIVPGGTDQAGEIDDIIENGGIRVLERVSLEKAEARAEDIIKKFTAGGFATEKEFLCND